MAATFLLVNGVKLAAKHAVEAAVKAAVAAAIKNASIKLIEKVLENEEIREKISKSVSDSLPIEMQEHMSTLTDESMVGQFVKVHEKEITEYVMEKVIGWLDDQMEFSWVDLAWSMLPGYSGDFNLNSAIKTVMNGENQLEQIENAMTEKIGQIAEEEEEE